MTSEPLKLPSRERAALSMLLEGTRPAECREPGEYLVPSRGRSESYRMRPTAETPGGLSCSCSDYTERLDPCKHILFLRHWLHDPPEDPVARDLRIKSLLAREGRPFYSFAQQEEGRLFPILLRELCTGIGETLREPGSPGRPPVPMRDQAFCTVQKIFTGFSGRQTKSHRVEAALSGMIDSAPYWDVCSKFLRRPESTPIMLELVARSALPLKALEDRCAVDSTGFRTTRFHHYREEKYNPRRKNIWLKCHALVGIRTHGVLSVEVTDGSAGDAPVFPLLVQRAKDAGFVLKEVLADRAYNSRANFQVSEDHGMTALTPFKSNQTGRSGGCPAYHKMYLFFSYDREKFEARYRDRAQVEVTFGSIKQKIGETVLSRTFTAQVNEILGRIVVHNISMLVQAMYRRGALPDFLHPRNRPEVMASVRETSLPTFDLSFNPPDDGVPVVLSSSSR